MQKLLAVVTEVLSASELVDGEVTNGYTFDEKGNKVYHKEKGKFIKDPTTAQELLPATEGFFFGSTDYDQYYYQDLVDTKKILEEALKDGEGDYQYQSSW